MGYKTNLKGKHIETISSVFSDHNCMKPAIHHRKRNEKKTDCMKTKQHATNKTKRSMRKSKGKFKNTWKPMIMKTKPFKIYGTPQKTVFRGKFRAIQAFLRKE